MASKVGRTRIIAASDRRRRVAFAGIGHKRVRWVALADPEAIHGQAAAARALR